MTLCLSRVMVLLDNTRPDGLRFPGGFGVDAWCAPDGSPVSFGRCEPFVRSRADSWSTHAKVTPSSTGGPADAARPAGLTG